MNIEIQQVATQIVGFLLLLWLMRRFAWGPLLALLDARREKIASEIEELKKARDGVLEMQRAYEGHLNQIENVSKQKFQEAVAHAERVGQEMLQESRVEANRIIEKAKEKIDHEILKARLQMREEIVALTLAVAGKVVRQEINAERNKELVREYIGSTHA